MDLAIFMPFLRVDLAGAIQRIFEQSVNYKCGNSMTLDIQL
jgi:hypothetical protein